MTALIAFLPDEAYMLIPIGLGILVILRVLSLGRAIGILGLLLAFVLIGPFLSGLLEFLPLWALLILMFFFLYGLIHGLTGAAVGEGVRDHFFGNILYGLFLLPLKLTARVLRSIFRTIFRRAQA